MKTINRVINPQKELEIFKFLMIHGMGFIKEISLKSIIYDTMKLLVLLSRIMVSGSRQQPWQ